MLVQAKCMPIISENGIPYDWKESYIVSLYNGERDAPNRENSGAKS